MEGIVQIGMETSVMDKRLEIIKFPHTETKVADVCDAAKENDFVFIIGYVGNEPSFYCSKDMTQDEMEIGRAHV